MAFFENVFFRRPRVGNLEGTDEVSLKKFHSKSFKSDRNLGTIRGHLGLKDNFCLVFETPKLNPLAHFSEHVH